MKKSFLIFSIVLGLFLFSSLNPNLISAQYIITDSYGDASTNDILSISGGFNGTNLLLGANFRPGTFNSNNLGFAWGLDTNLDGLTDYETYFNSLRNPAQMLLQKIIRPNVWNIAYIPVSFGANS
ncbi:MAG: hypothetical protein ACXWMJ_08680, partial [Syntrophales bacterium]